MMADSCGKKSLKRTSTFATVACFRMHAASHGRWIVPTLYTIPLN